MNIGIVGLGLIGGSMARAYKFAGDTVYGFDKDSATLGYAILSGIADGELNKNTLGECELLLTALYPDDTVCYLRENAAYIPKNCTVIDLCGTKRKVCEVGFSLAEEYGFTYVGGHPMAGTQFSGIKYSRKDLFKGAPMVIVPPRYDDMALLDRIKTLLSPALFGSFSVTTAERHDEMIAFTSQLAHIVSNAYIKSETAKNHGGFSAGSYKDMTRVAWLNENMWTQLFTENSDNLVKELNYIINSLGEYKTALENGDSETLKTLLRDGRILKEEIDGNHQKKA